MSQRGSNPQSGETEGGDVRGVKESQGVQVTKARPLPQQGIDVGQAGPLPAGGAGQNQRQGGALGLTERLLLPQQTLVLYGQPAQGHQTPGSAYSYSQQLYKHIYTCVYVRLCVCVGPVEGLLVQDVLQLDLTDGVQSGEVILRTEICRRRSVEPDLKGRGGEVHLSAR